ncbi:MAG: hypothetical protein RL090_1758 [Bacteroidota bacterium]
MFWPSSSENENRTDLYPNSRNSISFAFLNASRFACPLLFVMAKVVDSLAEMVTFSKGIEVIESRTVMVCPSACWDEKATKKTKSHLSLILILMVAKITTKKVEFWNNLALDSYMISQ